MTKPGSERRRAPRIPADFPIRLRGEGEAQEGRLRDLSEIGLCCTYPEAIEEMTLVQIGLELPGDDEVVEVKGAVVRCEEMAGSEKAHEIAVYFTETPAESRNALKAWVTRATEAIN